MKKRFLLTTSLAMFLGVGVAVGARQSQRYEQVVAGDPTETTVYCVIKASTLGAYTLKCNVHYGTNGGDPWGQFDMTDTGKTYNSDAIYKAEFTDKWGGLGTLQFQLYEGSTHKGEVAPFSDKWTTPDNYNGKMWVYDGGSSWIPYSDDTTTQYDVNVVVIDKNGTPASPVAKKVSEGDLPENPVLEYGEQFSGWFANYEDGVLSEEVTAINSNCTVYGQISDRAPFICTVDLSLVSEVFDTPYFYSFDAATNKELKAWPGNPIEDNQIEVATGANIVINNNTSPQTVDISQYGADEVLYILNSQTDEKYNYFWGPAAQGYYISGIDGKWTYSDSTKMQNTTEDGNVAVYRNLTVKVNDEIRVRSFYTDRTDVEAWADYGRDSEEFGEVVNDNFKFSAAGSYDVYAKYVEDAFKFFIAEHVDTYEIQMTAVNFEGRVKVGTANLDNQTAYAGSEFNPAKPSQNGYVAMKVYEDENCTVEYEPKAFDAAGHLYVKYLKLGYYLVGDDAFSGGTGKGWNAENSTYLPAAVNDTVNNLLEGTFVIPEGASKETPVEVRPAELTSEGTLDYSIEYSISDYDFAKKVGNNIQFTESGTFAIYVNKSLVVYLNKGLDAFNTKFLTDVGGVCTGILGGTKALSDLKAIWLEEKLAFESLSADEKKAYTDLTIDDGDEKGNDQQKVIAKYKYIVTKYGTDNCVDFIWGDSYTAQSGFVGNTSSTNNESMFLIIAVAFVTVTSIAIGLYFINRRKER